MRINVGKLKGIIILMVIFCPLAWAADKLDNDSSLLLEPMVQKDKPAPPEKQPKAAPAPAKTPKATVTLKGKGNQAEILDSNGKQLDEGNEKLIIPRGSGTVKPAAKSAATPKTAAPTKAAPNKAAPKTAAAPKASAPKGAVHKTAAPTKKPAGRVEAAPPAKDDVPDPKLAKAKAEKIKQQDIAKLRELQKQGGSYFYTKDNRPIGPEELEKRLESGDVAEIKTIDLHLQEWKTESKPATPEKKLQERE